MQRTSSPRRPSVAPLCSGGAETILNQLQEPRGVQAVNSKTYYYRLTLSQGPSGFHSLTIKVSGRHSSILQWRRGYSVVYCPVWGWSPAGGSTAAPGPAWTERETHEKGQNRDLVLQNSKEKKQWNKEDKWASLVPWLPGTSCPPCWWAAWG